MTYPEATAYLFNSAPLFQNVGQGAYKEGLQNTLALDEHFGHPHRRFRTIHVAGTNGKGSCSHTLAAVLQHAGFKVGLYTSPHLVNFRERIRINGKMIPEERVTRFVEQERSFFEPLHPSFFELATALAFQYFAEEGVDIAVIEVGLGGRLDCTNIIQPLLSIITNISFDHIQFLGNTLPAIAREKAGIIKAGVPVVIGETNRNSEVRDVFLSTALRKETNIVFADESHIVISSQPMPDGTRHYVTSEFGMLTGELGGLCQEKNTATILCAVTELRKLGIDISNYCVRQGFASVCKTTGLMGRWQQISASPLTICDTGHNPGGLFYITQQFEAFLKKRTTSTGGRLHIVVGMVNDKDITGSLRLFPHDATYYFTQASVKRALPADDFAQTARTLGLSGDSYPTVTAAYQAAQKSATPNDMIFIGGSTFIVADFLAAFTG